MGTISQRYVSICFTRISTDPATGSKLNAGAFMFGLSGVYISDDQHSTNFPSEDDEYDLRLMIVIFKGTEPHCGFAPLFADPDSPLSKANAVHRVGLVLYLPGKAIERSLSKMIAFPPSFFACTANEADTIPSGVSGCSCMEFAIMFACREDHIRFHATEGLLRFNNHMNSIGIQLSSVALSHLLSDITITDPDGSSKQASLEPFKLILGLNSSGDRATIQWYIEHCDESNLRIQREIIKGGRTPMNKPKLSNASEVCLAIASAARTYDAFKHDISKIKLLSQISDIRWDSQTKTVSLKCAVVLVLIGDKGRVYCGGSI